MKEPYDATLDVKASIREIHTAIAELRSKFVDLRGARLAGAGDAVASSGLATLQQLNGVESRALQSVADAIATLKKNNPTLL